MPTPLDMWADVLARMQRAIVADLMVAHGRRERDRRRAEHLALVKVRTCQYHAHLLVACARDGAVRTVAPLPPRR